MGGLQEYASYLARADDKETITPLRFELPTVTSVMTTYSSDLTTVPTFMFGTENNYAIDIGVSERLQISFARVNPPQVDDT